MGEKQSSIELDLIALLLPLRVAEPQKHRERNDSEWSQRSEQWCGVGNACDQGAVYRKDSGQQIQTGKEKMRGQKPRSPKAGKKRVRSRLGTVFPSQEPVGVAIQGFLRLLAQPRPQHRKRPR